MVVKHALWSRIKRKKGRRKEKRRRKRRGRLESLIALADRRDEAKKANVRIVPDSPGARDCIFKNRLGN